MSEKIYITEAAAQAMASKYGLLEEYKDARRRGYSIEEALDEWDLLDPDQLFLLNEIFD